jgi:hypothetical protein
VATAWVAEDEVSRALRDDRPSTGPLGRCAKAALVSGSSSVLLGRRRRVSAGWVAAPRGAAAVLIGWLPFAATRAGCVAPPRGGFMCWTGCVAA